MTIEIKKFTALHSSGTVEIHILISSESNSERVTLRLLTSQYAEIKPRAGLIDRELFEELQRASVICDAYLRGENILSFGANTAHALKLKLRRRGFDEDIAEEAISMLSERGFITEDVDMQREIQHCIRKKWGSRRIIAHLYSKGYNEESISAAEDLLENTDFCRLCLSLVMDKYESLPRDPKERQKLFASLSRYGYSAEEIKFAWNNFSRSPDTFED